MIGWLLSLFRKNGVHVYSPSEKLIYRFFNGEKWIDADPMVLSQRLADVSSGLAIDCQVAGSGLKEAPKATASAVKTIRGIFGIKPLADDLDTAGTLSNDQCVDLFLDYRKWTASVKKNSRPTPTSAKGTSVPTGPSSVAAPATTSTLDSGSTGSGNSTGSPPPSPTGPRSPSASSPPPRPILRPSAMD